MNENLKRIFYTAVGISALIFVISAIGLLMNVFELNLLMFNINSGSGVEAQSKSIQFIKWTSLSLFFMCIPFIAASVSGSLLHSDKIRLTAIATGGAIIFLSVLFMLISWNFAFIDENSIDNAALTLLSANRANMITLVTCTLFITLADLLGLSYFNRLQGEIK